MFTEGVITKKEKALLAVALFAARREEQEMLHMTNIAVEEGNTTAEIAECIASTIISRGIPAWLSGVGAIEKSIMLQGEEQMHLPAVEAFQTEEECITYYRREFEILPQWVDYLISFAPDTLLKYSNLRTTSLKDGLVSRLHKELLLYAINICDQYEKGIAIHKANAKQLGAGPLHLQEIKELCVYAVGIRAVIGGK